MTKPTYSLVQASCTALSTSCALPQMALCVKDVLPVGAHVQVYSASGNLEFESILSQAQDREVYFLAILTILLRRHYLPHPCISILWHPPQVVHDEIHHVGQMVLQRLSETDHELLSQELGDRCQVCCLPCVDADDQGFDRRLNCVRCLPCCVCDTCRINIPEQSDDISCCLLCLEPEEVLLLSSKSQARYQLLVTSDSDLDD